MHYMRERSLHIDLYKKLCKDLSSDDFYFITGTFSDLRLCQSLLITLKEQVRKLEMENRFLTGELQEKPVYSITADDVKQLRETTGDGMMACHKALVACSGDMEKAVEYMRVSGNI